VSEGEIRGSLFSRISDFLAPSPRRAYPFRASSFKAAIHPSEAICIVRHASVAGEISCTHRTIVASSRSPGIDLNPASTHIPRFRSRYTFRDSERLNKSGDGLDKRWFRWCAAGREWGAKEGERKNKGRSRTRRLLQVVTPLGKYEHLECPPNHMNRLYISDQVYAFKTIQQPNCSPYRCKPRSYAT
jgi:hypothetical protein